MAIDGPPERQEGTAGLSSDPSHATYSARKTSARRCRPIQVRGLGPSNIQTETRDGVPDADTQAWHQQTPDKCVREQPNETPVHLPPFRGSWPQHVYEEWVPLLVRNRGPGHGEAVDQYREQGEEYVTQFDKIRKQEEVYSRAGNRHMPRDVGVYPYTYNRFQEVFAPDHQGIARKFAETLMVQEELIVRAKLR